MGCGKSKHGVATETTIVKSSMSDGSKETSTTKTVPEKGDSSLVQKEVETRSLVVEDTKKETTKTNVDHPIAVAKTDNVAPTSEENVTKAEDVVPTSSKDDVRVPEVVEEDEEKKESKLALENKVKTDNLPPTIMVKTKESNLIKDNHANTEYMTPTLREDPVGPTQVMEDGEIMVFKEEKVEDVIISDEKSGDSINDVPIPGVESLEVEEEEVVAPTEESTTLESNKEEDIEETTSDIVDTESSPVIEPKEVQTVP